MFQGELDLAPCLLRGEMCPNCATCPLRRTIKIEEIEALAVERLRRTTIASLV